MSGRRYTVEFRIYSPTLDPAQVTHELRLNPCKVATEGAPQPGSRSGRTRKGMWAYDGEEGRNEWESLSDGLVFLLDKLWPHREAISAYGKNGSLIWWCGDFQTSFSGGPTFSPELLKQLGDFGAELYIDNYFSPVKEGEVECA